MPDSQVPREVAQALRASLVEVSVGKDGLVTLVSADRTRNETLVFSDMMERKFVFRLSVLYDVPIHWFWNPGMIPGAKAKRAGSVH